MKCKLNNVNGKVGFILKTGSDFVKGTTDINTAQRIVKNGTVKKSNIKEFPINVSDKWFFEGKIVANKTQTKGAEDSEK